MITSVDTNIILDVLIPGESFAQSSKMLLERHLAKGELKFLPTKNMIEGLGRNKK